MFPPTTPTTGPVGPAQPAETSSESGAVAEVLREDGTGTSSNASRTRLVDQEQGFRGAAAVEHTAGDQRVIQSYGDVGRLNRREQRRNGTADALNRDVAEQLSVTFRPGLRRVGNVSCATHGAAGGPADRADDYLRASQARKQGQDSHRKNNSAKTYHFLLLVNFEIESVEVLQPEPQRKT
jgi:hypothetical protein